MIKKRANASLKKSRKVVLASIFCRKWPSSFIFLKKNAQNSKKSSIFASVNKNLDKFNHFKLTNYA